MGAGIGVIMYGKRVWPNTSKARPPGTSRNPGKDDPEQAERGDVPRHARRPGVSYAGAGHGGLNWRRRLRQRHRSSDRDGRRHASDRLAAFVAESLTEHDRSTTVSALHGVNLAFYHHHTPKRAEMFPALFRLARMYPGGVGVGLALPSSA